MMHIPALTPACWTDGPATPRTAWAHDRGRGCGNAADPAEWERNLHHTPGCAGCSRARHALAVSAGVAAEMPIKKGEAP